MPQSLYYQNRRSEIRDARMLKESVATGLGLANASALDTTDSAHSRVTLTWREQASYDRAVKIYPFVQNVLVPDIAFQLGPFIPIRKNSKLRVDILFLLRTDKESVVSSQRGSASIHNLLYNHTGNSKNVTFRVADWNDRLEIFNSDDVFNVTTAIELLSLGTVVVCDRLHAAILSYLAGLPFVYLDQTSGKLTKTLTTAFSDSDGCLDGGKADWTKAENLENAISKAMDMLDRSRRR
jgi:exopolysaccharide biosynthesis predicted pyruvyltransferase EpsI